MSTDELPLPIRVHWMAPYHGLNSCQHQSMEDAVV